MTRTPTEMELRVAKVLDPAAFGEQDPGRLSGYYASFQQTALMKARAAIRAMREPTAIVTGPDFSPSDIWRAMIDAASPRTPEEALTELTRVSQELGLYDMPPEGK